MLKHVLNLLNDISTMSLEVYLKVARQNISKRSTITASKVADC